MISLVFLLKLHIKVHFKTNIKGGKIQIGITEKFLGKNLYIDLYCEFESTKMNNYCKYVILIIVGV